MIHFDFIAEDELINNIVKFNIDEISEILTYLGFEVDKQLCKAVTMTKFVFLYGDENEIYTKRERLFIESIEKMYTYPTFHKRTKRGLLPCQIIATEIETNNELKDAIFFIKEVNKATNGFNVFFIKANQQFFLGIRLLNGNSKEDFLISTPVVTIKDLENISSELYYVKNDDDFIEYYISLIDALESTVENGSSYAAQTRKNREDDLSYISMLNEIEQTYKLDFTDEISRYNSTLEKTYEIEYATLLEDVAEELKFIVSTKMNTMEVLFEAEEMELLLQKTAEENERISVNQNDGNNYIENTSEIKNILDDPEKMIKYLKQRKGI